MATKVIGKSLRDQLSRIVPNWIANLPGLANLYKFLWTVALLGDCLQEIAWQGQYAAYPGVGTPTALPLIATSRGLLQGPNEPDDTFAARAIAWLQAAALMGSSEGLALAIQAYLTNPDTSVPVVRVLDRSGNSCTAHADRSITFETVTWDWDELGGWVYDREYFPAEVDTFWSDLWILIEDFSTHYTGFGDTNWLTAWNFGAGQFTLDGLIPQSTVAGVFGLAKAIKGAHMWIRSIVFVPDPTTFTPSGYYGNASRNIAGLQTRERTATNAYWARNGG